MNLLIDVGYTAIKAAWADGITLGKTFRYQGERTADFILGLVEKNRPDVMVLSSVREFSQTAISKFGKCCGKFILIDSEHNFILEDNALPAYLTPDRAASVIAAQYLFKGRAAPFSISEPYLPLILWTPKDITVEETYPLAAARDSSQ